MASTTSPLSSFLPQPTIHTSHDNVFLYSSHVTSKTERFMDQMSIVQLPSHTWCWHTAMRSADMFASGTEYARNSGKHPSRTERYTMVLALLDLGLRVEERPVSPLCTDVAGTSSSTMTQSCTQLVSPSLDPCNAFPVSSQPLMATPNGRAMDGVKYAKAVAMKSKPQLCSASFSCSSVFS